MPMQSRLIASRFLTSFPIDRNDGISYIPAQKALPSIRVVTGAFIFQRNGDHETVTTKAGHPAALSRIRIVTGPMACSDVNWRRATPHSGSSACFHTLDALEARVWSRLLSLQNRHTWLTVGAPGVGPYQSGQPYYIIFA